MSYQTNKLLRPTKQDEDAGAAMLGQRAFTEYDLLKYYFKLKPVSHPQFLWGLHSRREAKDTTFDYLLEAKPLF